jgi:arylsulfatase A-like enzyme
MKPSILALSLCATLLPALAAEMPAGKPNLIVIMADDLGYGDMARENLPDVSWATALCFKTVSITGGVAHSSTPTVPH